MWWEIPPPHNFGKSRMVGGGTRKKRGRKGERERKEKEKREEAKEEKIVNEKYF